MTERIGILGAGNLGSALARLAVAAGYEVRIAGSGDPKFIALGIETFARGAVATTAAEAIDGAHLVILALPLHRVEDLPADALAGHIVVDATNYWADVDGPLPQFTRAPGGTSTAVAAHLRGARVVKALGHMSYEDLESHARDSRRVAVGVASDHAAAADAVAAFVDRLGFAPVAMGPLAAGVALQPGSLVFGRTLRSEAMLRIAAAKEGTENTP